MTISLATERTQRGQRVYVSAVIAIIFATTAVSLYDMYLLVSLLT